MARRSPLQLGIMVRPDVLRDDVGRERDPLGDDRGMAKEPRMGPPARRTGRRRWGPQRRDPIREASIFKSFVGRWGVDAKVISQYVFEIADGFWMGSPVTINRWTKGSDPYFATVIIQKLAS